MKQVLSSQRRDHQQVRQRVFTWLERVVIGLGLCPFAQAPLRHSQLRVIVSDATDSEQLLQALESELQLLAGSVSDTDGYVETTLLVTPRAFADFLEFNDFLATANQWLGLNGWEGEFQLASFHPQYQFAGTHPDDLENFTNVAPYPIIHLLREDSITQAVVNYPGIEEIPTRNIKRMRGLSAIEKNRLFGFLND